ncbi:MAG TPA: hypothetical protein DEB06_06165, partial [Phycisphaerales bacterium]|nr:hypothetical protein [Phycisphaerales bacterium]
MLRAEGTTEAVRRAAASELVNARGANGGEAALIAALGPAFPTPSRLSVAGALAGAGVNDPALLVPLESMLSEGDPLVIRGALAALVHHRSKDGVRPVVDLLARLPTPAPSGVTESVIECLIAQTGMFDLGSDAARWLAWWEQAQFLPEAQWRGQIAEAQARRAARAAEAERRAARALTDLFRRLYAAREDEERSDLLVEMVRSDTVEVREAGLELVQRRLLNANPVSDAVGAAILERLGDAKPAVRAGAARILERIDRPDAVEPIYAALGVARAPYTAGALLRA